MKKAFLSLAMAALLVAMLVVPTLAASGDVVWKMSADDVAAYVVNNGSDIEWIKNCGGGSRAQEGNGIKVFDRGNDYDCIDIVTSALDTSKEYTVVAKVKTAAGGSTTFKFGMGAGPYEEYVAVDGASATLTYKITAGFAFAKNLRLQTNGTTEDFIIESVTIYEGEPPVASASTGGNAKTGDSTMIFLALGVLALAGCATVLVARKVKA